MFTFHFAHVFKGRSDKRFNDALSIKLRANLPFLALNGFAAALQILMRFVPLCELFLSRENNVSADWQPWPSDLSCNG
jgi:hypothetical protein